MDFLYRGAPPKERIWIGRCSVCSSVYRAKQSELGKIEPGDYRSDNEAWSRADCILTGCNGKKTVVLHPEDSGSARDVLRAMGR